MDCKDTGDYCHNAGLGLNCCDVEHIIAPVQMAEQSADPGSQGTATENAQAFFPVAKVSWLTGRGGSGSIPASDGVLLASNNPDSGPERRHVRPTQAAVLADFAGNHIGNLDDLPVLAMIGARLHVRERSPLHSLQGLAHGGAQIADLSHISALEIDEQPLVRPNGVRTAEHESNGPISDAIGTA